MGLGGITDYLKTNNISTPEDYSSVPYLPYAQQGPYQAIMSQMGNYGGGAGTGYQQGAGNVYGGGGGSVMGGYNPDLYKRAPVAPITDSYMYGGANASGGRGLSLEAQDIKNSQDAWTNLTDEEKSDYFSENPTMLEVQEFLTGAFPYKTEAWERANQINLTARGRIAADKEMKGFGGSLLGSTGAAPGSSTAPSLGADNNINPGWGSRDAGGGTSPGGEGGGYTGGDQTSGESKDMPSSFSGIGASPYAKGGPVSMNRLQGPNPAGPDDGYATLKSGEFVINDKAVKKYGIELMNAINSGKISKGKLRGLLEM